MKTFDGIYVLSRWSLGVLFIYAGGIKLMEPVTFAVLIEAYGILPDILLMPVAVTLPVLEVVAGIGLLFDIQASLETIVALLVLFIIILGYGIRMGLDVDCGCFGAEDPEAKAFHGLRLSFYRDLIMLTGCIFIYGWRRYRGVRPLKLMMLTKKKQVKKGSKDHAYV